MFKMFMMEKRLKVQVKGFFISNKELDAVNYIYCMLELKQKKSNRI